MFFILFVKSLFASSVTQSVCFSLNRLLIFFGSETPKHNAFDVDADISENLNSILNIFQETQDFLILTDSKIICIYLRRS